MKIKINFLVSLITIGLLFSMQFSSYTPDIFILSNSINKPYTKSMSIENNYTLGEYHTKGKTLYTFGSIYSNRISYMNVSHILVSNKKYKLGISILSRTIREISNTQDAWNDNGGNLSIDKINYDNITTYKDQQSALIILNSFNLKFAEIGIKLKPLYNSLQNHHGYGFSADIGINKIIKKKLNLGLSIDNIVSLIGWTSGEQYSIYPSLSFSSELNLNKNTILNEISISSSMHDIKKNIEFHAGYNRDINEKIRLQLFYSTLSSVTLGLGVKHRLITYNYNFNPNINNIILGHNHYFSILLDLSTKN